MTDPKDIQAASIVQHFWESGLLLVGFVALFWWDGGVIGLKIVLGLILVRACFSWSEISVLEKQIASMALDNQKHNAILQALLCELNQKIEKANASTEQSADTKEAAHAFMEKIANAERAFEESYEQNSRIGQMLSLSVGARAWSSMAGTVVQIVVLAILGWGVAELIDKI